ncbi:MAG: DUF5522 domain-containing protein [Acidobacteria bacterium]|nr:DUF5522 domain-containing protein [Acidobacteriota bacterium]MCA1608626.1 DUF5522 domain-containing protein [Acidobacteriota bacterium]
MKQNEPTIGKRAFIEDEDYYFDGGLMVLTAAFLRDRGFCCGRGCRHCPYTDSERLEAQSRNSSNSL